MSSSIRAGIANNTSGYQAGNLYKIFILFDTFDPYSKRVSNSISIIGVEHASAKQLAIALEAEGYQQQVYENAEEGVQAAAKSVPKFLDVTKDLRVYSMHLRKKIEKNQKNPTFIITEPKIGYKFISTPDPELS